MTPEGFPTIGLVAPQNGPDGQAVQAAFLACQLRAAGYEVMTVSMDPPLPSGMRWLNHAGVVCTLVSVGRYLPTLRRLRRTDIVHLYSASSWAFLMRTLPALLMARRFGKPVVLDYHGSDAADHLGRCGPLVHPWLKRADEIIVPSISVQQAFASHGYRARVIHNIVDTSRFHYRTRLPLRPRLLSTRSLEARNGVEQTLIAFALVKTTFPYATLTVAGSGSQEEELRQLTHALGLTDVYFLGRIEPDAMPSIYDESDVFLNSSYSDTQPLSVLEAMASGLPIVTTGVGDIANMIQDGASGTLVPVGDPAAMAKTVTVLLGQPERAVLMAQRAKEALEPYTWSEVWAQWADVYGNLHHVPDIRHAA